MVCLRTLAIASLAWCVIAMSVGVSAQAFEAPLTDDAWINANAPNLNVGTSDTLFVHDYGPKRLPAIHSEVAVFTVYLVGRARIERATNRLKVCCSTD